MFKDGTTAACFPASVAIAAGFDESVAKEIGRALAEETQTKGAFVL
jgi:beta-glucosidase